MRRIVFGIGRIAESDPHLSDALELAAATGAELYVVHAYRIPDPMLYPYAEMTAFDPELIAIAREQVEQQMAERLKGAGPHVHGRVLPTPADMAILETAEEVAADLILVGATERGAVSRVLLGTTAGRVMRGARAPVLIRRRATPGPLRRVLMTTDLSDASAEVYHRGARLAAELSTSGAAELRTVFVVDDIPGMPELPLDQIRAKELRPFLARAGVESECALRTGDPAREIAAEAEEWGADLVVVGTHGRGGVSRLLIGSVAEAVARRAPCDVLVIPAASLAGPPAGGGSHAPQEG